jgi:hypothetical protein
MNKYLKSLTMYLPSSGSGRHSEQGSAMTENAVNSILSPHADAEHRRTLNPERHENTRQRSVRDWGGESWNVLRVFWCEIAHRRSWWKRRPDLLVCDCCGRTWFRSGWEQGEWP